MDKTNYIYKAPIMHLSMATHVAIIFSQDQWVHICKGMHQPNDHT